MKFLDFFQKKEKPVPKIPMVIFSDAELKTLVGNIFQLNDIEKEFGLILKNVGISEDEVCSIENWHQNPSVTINLNADCYLQKSQEALKLKLEKMGGLDMMIPDNTIKVISQNTEKTYCYYNGSTEQSRRKEKNTETGSELKIAYCYSQVKYFLSNPENSVDITFHMPKDQTYIKHYKITNDEELINYLLNLEFPIDFDGLCDELKGIYYSNNCSELEVKIKTQVYGNSELIDVLRVDDSGITDFMITKDGQSYVACNNALKYLELNRIAIERNLYGFVNNKMPAKQNILKLQKKK